MLYKNEFCFKTRVSKQDTTALVLKGLQACAASRLRKAKPFEPAVHSPGRSFCVTVLQARRRGLNAARGRTVSERRDASTKTLCSRGLGHLMERGCLLSKSMDERFIEHSPSRNRPPF